MPNPSAMHEGLVSLFRNRTTLAPEMLEALGVALPPYSEARIEDADLSLAPKKLLSDAVVLLVAEKPVFGIVLEVQLSSDHSKVFNWPLYAAALRQRTKAPSTVLVVTPDAKIATQAARPIPLGPDSVFQPQVLGPEGVPALEDIEVAARAPELAVLSAMAYGERPEGGRVAAAALAGIQSAQLDASRSSMYADLVFASLGAAAKREFETMVTSGKYEYQSEFAKKYIAKGKAEGKAEGEALGKADALLRIISGRGWSLSEDHRVRIASCTDITQLDRWIDVVLVADSLEQMFDHG